MTKSRTLRKAGAVVLSLAMAFSVAGVAPSADAAAKKPALSAKKGTITVGKKKAVKVKNTTAKKVKKLVVSSNKKAVATVKKNSNVKFTVTGKKAGTAKITAKVRLKKKVAGKKVYTLKYTATVKKAATTPTEAPVQTVAPTPTVEPTAAPEEDLAITAEQIGGSKIKVTSNNAIALTDKVTVKRGSSTVDCTFTLDDETGKTLTVTTGAKLAEAEYEVTVTPADTKKKAASAKFVGKAAKLVKIDFVGTNLVLKNTAFTQAAVKIFGYNDFDEKVSLPSLTPYTTKGTSVKYEASSNEIVVTTGSTAPFQSGEQVTITAIYQDGTNVQQVSKALTISAQASLAKIEFGELQTTNTALNGKPFTINNIKTGTYYKTVKAEDQYGNTLTAKDLNGMIYSSTNTSGTLFVTPNQEAGSYVYLDSFDTDTKDNVIARFKLGALGMAGTQTFTYTGVGGFSATDSITIVDNPFIAELTVTAPEMYGGKEAELSISAKDQDGNALDLYNYVAKSDELTTTAAAQEFKFTDQNSVTKACSKITIPKDMAFKVVKNTTTKTVKFTVTPAANPTANNVTYILVVQSAKPTVANVNCVVQSDPAAYSISNKLKTSASNAATLKSGKTFNFEAETLILDQYGASFGYVAAKSTLAAPAGPVLVNKGAAITDAGSIAGANYAVQFKDATGAIVADPTAVGTAGKYTAELWYDEDGTTATIKAKLLDTKTFTINVADTKYSNYTASLSSADKLLYIGGQADKETIKVTAQDSTGTTVTLDAGADYTVQIADVPDNSGAVATCDPATGEISSVVGKAIAYSAVTGEAKGDITANVFVGADQVASVKVPYSNAPQKTASYVCKKGAAWATGTAYDLSQGITIGGIAAGTYEFSKATAGDNWLAIDTDGTATSAAMGAATEYIIKAVDQYGLSNFDVTFGSDAVAANAGNTALWADAGTVTLSGSLTSNFKIETKNGTYKKVLTHVSGTFEKVAPGEASPSTALAASFVDQYGKAMTVTAKTPAAAMTPAGSNASTATMEYEYDADGKIKITATKGGSGTDKGAKAGDKWTVTDATNAVNILITVTCTKSATDTTASNAGAEFTVTASYN